VWNEGGIQVKVIVPKRLYETSWFWIISGFVFTFLACVFIALCVQLIANKTGTKDGWFAWIPVLNLYLMCRIANKPIWWILLCFIPVINVVVFVILWCEISKARQKPAWFGIVIMLVPIIGFIFIGLLAFSKR